MDMMVKEAKEVHIHHRRVVPIVIKYTGFENGKDNDEIWYSEGFYNGIGGYNPRKKLSITTRKNAIYVLTYIRRCVVLCKHV